MAVTKKFRSIIKTKLLDLCTSCEICLSVCPNSAISMEYKQGQFLPKIDEEKCSECGLCLQLCPGIDIIRNKIKKHHPLVCYSAYTRNNEIRKNSTSGGIITSLLINREEFSI